MERNGVVHDDTRMTRAQFQHSVTMDAVTGLPMRALVSYIAGIVPATLLGILASLIFRIRPSVILIAIATTIPAAAVGWLVEHHALQSSLLPGVNFIGRIVSISLIGATIVTSLIVGILSRKRVRPKANPS